MSKSRKDNLHTSAKGGTRPDIGIYVRSRWEANYARYLIHLKEQGTIASWEYEPDTFEFARIARGNRHYTPDFKVTLPDGSVEYHEVKGWMNDDSRVKLNRMARYYPDVKIILIDQKVYRGLAKSMRDTLPGWESSEKKAY